MYADNSSMRCNVSHLERELLVQALVVVAKLVGGLAVGDLVIPEPLQNLLQLTGEVPAARGEGTS